MNSIFSTETFWKLYLTLEDEELTEDNIDELREALRPEFTVRDETVLFEEEEEEEVTTYSVIEFPFSCGERFSLVIEYMPDPLGSERNLFLVDSRSGTKSRMGWWDLARWHPYCLRLSELDRLIQFWKRWDQRWPDPELPLLLLCQFVGLADTESRDQLSDRAETAFATLGLPQLRLSPPVLPALEVNEGHRWEIDPELGWVFLSDDYNCYSLRNRSHAGSQEESFPFEAFGEMMAEIEARLSVVPTVVSE